MADLLVRAVGRVEAHDPAAGLDDAREPVAVIAGDTQRGGDGAARRGDLPQLRRLFIDGLEARQDPKGAVLAESAAHVDAADIRHRRPDQRDGQPHRAEVDGRQRLGPMRERRPDAGHERHVVEIEGPRHVGKQVADRVRRDGRDGLHHFIVEYSAD